jgi:hypothetical protein
MTRTLSWKRSRSGVSSCSAAVLVALSSSFASIASANPGDVPTLAVIRRASSRVRRSKISLQLSSSSWNGPGDLSQNMGYPSAPPFGQPRPQADVDKVGFVVDKICAAGKIAGTLVTDDELPKWPERGVVLLSPFRSFPALA